MSLALSTALWAESPEKKGLEVINRSTAEAHIGFLADDDLEGREAGFRGGRIAGDYIVANLKSLGIDPVGDSYYHPFEAYHMERQKRGARWQVQPDSIAAIKQTGVFQKLSLNNILGKIEGKNPSEIVIVGAHYDHLGIEPMLDGDQISAFGSLLEPLPDEELTNRSEDAYAADCAARRAAGVAAFTATDTGFTAKTAYDTDELVFFSVPYDDGFSATVNGEPAAIEKVDDGLMAVYVPAGENEIEFTYHTPGLKVSACVSAAAIAVYGVYLLGIIIKRKSQPGSKR